ncbi:MAG: hypothetical protein WD042_00135 [Phycisphaeraceae bacterium]
MSRETKQTQALVDVWQILRRYPRRFVLPAFIVASLVLAVCLVLPRKYKAQATFERRTDMVLSEVVSRGAPRSFQDPRQSMSEEIIGQPAVDQVIQQVLAAPLAGLETLDADTLRHELTTKVTVTSDIATNDLDRVRVAYISENPDLARQVVNLLVQNYLDRTRSRIESRLNESAQFFRTEVQRSRTLIEELETSKLTFEIEHGELLPDSTHSLQSGRSDLRASLITLRQQHDEASLKLNGLRQALAATSETSPSFITSKNPDLSALEDQLRRMRDQLSTSHNVLKMTDKHPDVVDLRVQIQTVESQLSELPREVVTQKQVSVNPRRAELELLISNATAQEQSLGRQIKALEKQLSVSDTDAQKLFPVRSAYLKISRQVDEAQRQLAFWEDNLRRVEISLAAETGNRGVQLTFIKPAEVLSKPVSPNLTQAVAAALALGLAAGVISAFLAHRGDQTFRDAEQLAATYEAPLFGSVSELITRRQHRLRTWRRRVFFPLQGAAMMAVVVVMAAVLYLSLQRPESFKKLTSDPSAYLVSKVLGPVDHDSETSTPSAQD